MNKLKFLKGTLKILERKKEIQELFGIKDYECINLIFALHPSAHMTSETRESYEQYLMNFINY